MTFATQGLIGFPAAMALVLGENIGTTITAELATIGAENINAHRAARAHTLFNVLGVCLMLLIFPWFLQIVEWVTMLMTGGEAWNVCVGEEYPYVARYLANGHTLFNLLNAIFFLIFLPFLIKAAVLLSPKDKTEDDELLRLPVFEAQAEDNTLAALALVRGELQRLSRTVHAAYLNALECLEMRDLPTIKRRQRYEVHIDEAHQIISTFLARTMQTGLSEASSEEVSAQMRLANTLERIGDAVEVLGLVCEDIVERELNFNEDAWVDFYKISGKVDEFLLMIIDGLENEPDDLVEKARQMEEMIDAMRERMRDAHIERLKIGKCGIEGGLAFINLLSRLEKIGDHCYTIAQTVEKNR
jgi:phosphate:Na+ symporter